MLLVHLAQARAGDVCVNLSGADAGVAEEFLNHAQVRAVFQQVRGEAVPQHVRRDVPLDPGLFHAPGDAEPHGHVREGRAAFREEDIGRGLRADKLRAGDAEIPAECFHGKFPDRHDTFLVALADDGDEAGLEVKLFEPQAAQLREPQATGVGEFEDRLVAEVGRRARRERFKDLLDSSAWASALGTRFQRRGSERFSAGFADSFFSVSTHLKKARRAAIWR